MSVDIDFPQINGIKIPNGEVKYIAGTHGNITQGGSNQLLLWRRPNEFPYVIGAYKNANSTTEYFSPYYIEKYEEPVPVKAKYLPTYNGNISTADRLMATSSLVGTQLNAYACINENKCQDLHNSSTRGYVGVHARDPSWHHIWRTLDTTTGKILVYASTGQSPLLGATPNPQHIEGAPTYLRYQYANPLYLGAGFPIPYGELYTPNLCRVLDVTSPILTFKKVNNITTEIASVREDYSDYVTKYDEITSGAYPKSEYPYLDGVTELGFTRTSPGGGWIVETHYQPVFAFYIFFRVAR